MLLGAETIEAPTDISAFRREFPGADRWRYFDVAARGLLPNSARRAVDADLDARMDNGGDKAAMFRTIERVRERVARMLGAETNEIAITKNVSEGLNIVAMGYPWVAGDNVVVCAEREHPNNVYLWLHLARTRGVSIKFIDSVEGRIPTAAVLDAIDARTRIVTASTVSFVPGLRTDLDTIGRACSEKDIMFLADAAQSVGILKLDVKRSRLGAVAFSTQKGLLGLYGMGLLYCAADWAERLTPIYLARFGVDLGDAHEAHLGSLDFDLMPGARRYDLGNYNFTAAAALDESLQLLERAGADAVEQHVMRLSRRFAEGMHRAGFAVAGHPIQADFANMITIEDGGVCLGRIEEFGSYLKERGVRFSERRGALRFSCHLYNNVDDVDEVLLASEAWLRKGK